MEPTEKQKMPPSSIASLVLGIVGIVLGVLAFFFMGWMCFVGLACSIVGLCLKGKFSLKVPALIGTVVDAVAFIIWLLGLFAIIAM